MNEEAAGLVSSATGLPPPAGVYSGLLKRQAEKAKTEGNDKNPAAVALGRLGGLKGGKARAKALSPEERREIASRAAKARWEARRAAETPLTSKEKEILALIQNGKTAAEISKQLGVTSKALIDSTRKGLEMMKRTIRQAHEKSPEKMLEHA